MIETAADADHAAAATTDTGRAALLTTAVAGDRRALESLVDGCTEEEEAGAARKTDTSRGLGESPEKDPDRGPDRRPRERPSTRRRPPTTPRRK